MAAVRPVVPDAFPWFDHRRYTFTLGLDLGTHVYLSGHSASEYDPDLDRIVVRGDLETQTRTAYRKVEVLLGAVGLGFGDVVWVCEHLRSDSVDTHGTVKAVRAEVMGPREPAVTVVANSRLLRGGARVEVEVVAGRGGSRHHRRGDADPTIAGELPDGTVHLSSVGVDGPVGTTGTATLEVELERTYEAIADALRAVGLGLEHLVKTTEYVLDLRPETVDTLDRVRSLLPAPFPALTRVVMPRLANRGARAQIEVVASRSDRAVVDPGWEGFRSTVASPAIRAGDAIFISGQVSTDVATGDVLHGGDVVGQAEEIYARIRQVLHEVGDEAFLTKTVEYVTVDGLDRYRGVADVRRDALAAPFPASTGIVADAVGPGSLQLLVDPIARIP